MDQQVYEGLHAVIGRRNISQFVTSLVRPHVIKQDMDAAYRQMAADEERECEALECAEATIGDVRDDPRLGSQHKALADQITTVSKMRVGDKAPKSLHSGPSSPRYPSR